jgi:ribose transport system substrate-binding protein
MKGNNLSNQDSASVSTRRGFINAVAAAGGAALCGRLGISPAVAVEVTGRAERPLKAAFSNAGLQATWCAQGKRAAEYWGKVFNVEVTWFDGELSPTKQRKAVDNMATEKWDFVAIQALTEGTLTGPANKMIAAGIPVVSIDTLIAPYDQVNVHTRLTPDNNFMGTSVTQALVDAIGGEGNMVMTTGPLGFSAVQGRSRRSNRW